MSYKWWLFIAIFLFSAGLVLGLATPTRTATPVPQDIALLKKFADFLASLPQYSVLTLIFIKNVSALLISFAFSPVLCVIPVLALTVNGWLLGIVSATVLQEKSLGYLLAGVLPHGIFELPALMMGEAVALSFGTAVMFSLFRREREKLLLANFRQNLRYLIVAIVLFLIAAVIEVYVTPLFLR